MNLVSLLSGPPHTYGAQHTSSTCATPTTGTYDPSYSCHATLPSGPPRTSGAHHTSSTCATPTTGMCRQSTTHTSDRSCSCRAT